MTKRSTWNIELTAEDALAAASVATVQIVRKVHSNRNKDHGGTSARAMRLRFADGIHGIMAEIALARVLNLAWTPGGIRVSRGDVGGKIEVRVTEHPGGHLLVYENDDDSSPFVLMVGHYPGFRAAGYILARDAKRREWFNAKADPPGYWVPQAALNDLETLTA